MRYLRYLVLLVIGVFLITVAMANRETVDLHALPPDVAAVIGIDWKIRLPLFLVGFGGIVVGILIGFVWEWVREHKFRSTAKTMTREVARLERQVAVNAKPEDEVLALLEPPEKSR